MKKFTLSTRDRQCSECTRVSSRDGICRSPAKLPTGGSSGQPACRGCSFTFEYTSRLTPTDHDIVLSYVLSGSMFRQPYNLSVRKKTRSHAKQDHGASWKTIRRCCTQTRVLHSKWHAPWPRGALDLTRITERLLPMSSTRYSNSQ